MPILRLNQISMAGAEQLLAAIWHLLEEHRIGSPKLKIEARTDDCLDMELAFNAMADAAIVRRMLMRSRWSSFLKLDRAGAALARAERYRLRAEECRNTADGKRHPYSRDTWRRIAENYDLLGDLIEQRIGPGPNRKKPSA
jgi:hypothetical protein